MTFVMYILERQLSLRWREVFEIRQQCYQNLEQFEASVYYTIHLPPSKLKAQRGDDVCPSADQWDIGCPCVENSAAFQTGAPKRGFVLVIVPAKVVGDWLREWTKMIDTQHPTLKLRCIYAHAGKTYNNVNATPLTSDNAGLHRCQKDGTPQTGQERFLLLTTKGSYKKHVKEVLRDSRAPFVHNFRLG
jgi:hypothetical protein